MSFSSYPTNFIICMLSHLVDDGTLSLPTEGLVQKPREQQISANFNFCSKLAKILPLDLK